VIGDALHERIGGPERAIVFGAGHVGRALTPLLAGLGFEVIVCDDGDTGALATPVPGATQLVEDFELGAIERAIGGLGSGDHVFVVTRDHALDERLMLALIPRPLAYLGMIGSRGKVGRFQKRLAMRGIAPEAWRAVHAPIGLDLGAETPAEIAVAIAAELVALRHRRRGAFAGWTPR
jgi:xanthine dehydrogenase accessory factor